MVDAALAFTLLEVAVKHLYSLYKKHKDLKRELEEVGNFLVDLSANSPILNSKIGKLNHVKNTLQRKLESARKQVEEWSSSNSNFFRSDERLRKIQGVRQKVKDAMHEANTQLLVDAVEVLHDIQKRIPPQPPKNPAVPVKHPTPAKPDVQHPKPHPPKHGAQGIAKEPRPRSKSTPRKAPPSPVLRAAIPSTPRRDKTVELFVPMDSDKQARDVVMKLKALPGVKNAISEQTSKKVLVEPLKGVTLNTDQLLRHAHLENKFVRPTLWSKRPR